MRKRTGPAAGREAKFQFRRGSQLVCELRHSFSLNVQDLAQFRGGGAEPSHNRWPKAAGAYLRTSPTDPRRPVEALRELRCGRWQDSVWWGRAIPGDDLQQSRRQGARGMASTAGSGGPGTGRNLPMFAGWQRAPSACRVSQGARGRPLASQRRRAAAIAIQKCGGSHGLLRARV